MKASLCQGDNRENLSMTLAGFATVERRLVDWKMRIVVHDSLDGPSRFGVLCHELAHVFLEHLGCDQDNWWPSRVGIDRHVAEIEAEAVAYIVTTRFRLEGASARYVSRYLYKDQLPSTVSLDMIAKVAGRIERMARETLPRRRPLH